MQEEAQKNQQKEDRKGVLLEDTGEKEKHTHLLIAQFYYFLLKPRHFSLFQFVVLICAGNGWGGSVWAMGRWRLWAGVFCL